MTVDETPARGKNWARNQAHKRRRIQRHAARARIAGRADRSNCPRPDKAAYDKLDEAERRIQQRALGPGMQMYDCQCGWSHNGHPNPTDKPGSQ
jgi:hypothetical protein